MRSKLSQMNRDEPCLFAGTGFRGRLDPDGMTELHSVKVLRRGTFESPRDFGEVLLNGSLAAALSRPARFATRARTPPPGSGDT